MKRRSSAMVGKAPGELVHIGRKTAKKVSITLADYDAAHFSVRKIRRVEQAFPSRDDALTTWINIEGIQHTGVIKKLGNHFRIHPLIQEDILNTDQRPKLEEFKDHIFIVLKIMNYDKKKGEIKPEQISIVFGSDYVISFLERENPILDPIKERLRVDNGKIRHMGADYLAYALMDIVVDHYFVTLEAIGEKIEDLEDELLANPAPEALRKIHMLRQQMIMLRRSVWPLREVIASFHRLESKLIKRSVGVYLRDIYDHIIHITDTIESYRETLSGLLEIYLSSINNRMNGIMKVLTVITTIFIPLSFITGVYGMNFENMPELQWEYGYFFVWGVIIFLVSFMLTIFFKKKWL